MHEEPGQYEYCSIGKAIMNFSREIKKRDIELKKNYKILGQKIWNGFQTEISRRMVLLLSHQRTLEKVLMTDLLILKKQQ